MGSPNAGSHLSGVHCKPGGKQSRGPGHVGVSGVAQGVRREGKAPSGGE